MTARCIGDQGCVRVSGAGPGCPPLLRAALLSVLLDKGFGGKEEGSEAITHRPEVIVRFRKESDSTKGLTLGFTDCP